MFPLLALIKKFSLILLVLSSSPGGGMAATTHTLSNGAALEVDMTSPTNSSALPLDASCSQAVTSLSGFARVGQGVADVSYIFIVDYSGSITGLTEEVRAKILNDTEYMFGQPSTLNVGIVIFNSLAKSSNSGVLSSDKTAIMDYFSQEYTYPTSGTGCIIALNAARDMILNSPNVGSTTLVIFAGDGTCDNPPDPVQTAAQNLVATAL